MEASAGRPRRLRVDRVEVVLKEGAFGRNCLRRLVSTYLFLKWIRETGIPMNGIKIMNADQMADSIPFVFFNTFKIAQMTMPKQTSANAA